MKVASTINIVNAIKVYEGQYGPSVVTAINTVTSGSSIMFVIKTMDSNGKEHLINIPALEDDYFWKDLAKRSKD